MINTCVIGGGGFIGKYLVNQLNQIGRKVTVIGRKELSPFDSSINYLFNKDKSIAFYDNIFKDVDEVIELVYASTPQTSFDNPVKDIIENLAFSVSVFESLIKSNVKRVVYVSSGGTVYGHSIQIPIKEDHPTNPVSPYGITKLSTEKYGLMYYNTKNLPIVIVRPGNAYGPGQKPYLGQGFISTAVANILSEKALTIFGKSGTLRDYIYVEDVAAGIIAALEYGKTGECYNVGTSVGKTNLEIIELIKTILGIQTDKIHLDILPARNYDVQQNVLDIKKLELASGWKPRINVNKGLSYTIEWMQQHLSK